MVFSRLELGFARRDNLDSWFYLLIEIPRGSLPKITLFTRYVSGKQKCEMIEMKDQQQPQQSLLTFVVPLCAPAQQWYQQCDNTKTSSNETFLQSSAGAIGQSIVMNTLDYSATKNIEGVVRSADKNVIFAQEWCHPVPVSSHQLHNSSRRNRIASTSLLTTMRATVTSIEMMITIILITNISHHSFELLRLRSSKLETSSRRHICLLEPFLRSEAEDQVDRRKSV
ncbi:hypothetical protein X798_07970 [Onchocerca flexuosa]|uniref:Uncharacterized protein n=2 Tax=Onchocerca flexuosa TaxID=387005 RepID=A0A183H1R1_9BILA|nr:hypothetical protein X798_07970 [Onchocerca flexuosa]VDO29473.1 unnamed protein product [Onchocerca flexuosa]